MSSTIETAAAPNVPAAKVSKAQLWAGWVISILPVLLLLFSATGKILQPPQVAEGFAHLGYPMSLAVTLAILELACTVLYVIPQTSVFGAILLTAYLGGATATHVRVGDPLYTPIIAGVAVWIGLYLREPRLHALVPFRK